MVPSHGPHITWSKDKRRKHSNFGKEWQLPEPDRRFRGTEMDCAVDKSLVTKIYTLYYLVLVNLQNTPTS